MNLRAVLIVVALGFAASYAGWEIWKDRRALEVRVNYELAPLAPYSEVVDTPIGIIPAPAGWAVLSTNPIRLGTESEATWLEIVGRTRVPQVPEKGVVPFDPMRGLLRAGCGKEPSAEEVAFGQKHLGTRKPGRTRTTFDNHNGHLVVVDTWTDGPGLTKSFNEGVILAEGYAVRFRATCGDLDSELVHLNGIISNLFMTQETCKAAKIVKWADVLAVMNSD